MESIECDCKLHVGCGDVAYKSVRLYTALVRIYRALLRMTPEQRVVRTHDNNKSLVKE